MSLYGDISPRVGIYAVEKMLSHAEPIIVLQKMGQVRPVPKNKGEQVKFRRPNPWNGVVVGGGASANITGFTPPVLQEGVTPSAIAFTYTDVPVTLAEYGQWVEITDKIADLHEDPVLNDQTMLAGESAAEILELVTYNAIIGGTQLKRVGGTNRTDVNAKLDVTHVNGAVRQLQAQRAKKITSILGPSTMISTKPVEAAYVAFGHTDCAHDIRALAGFTPVAQYGNRQPLCPEEIGSVNDVRFILSPMFAPWLAAGAAVGVTGMKSVGAVSVDVYPIVFIGKEAFGTTPLKGFSSAHIMVLNPNTPRGGDPLGQRGSVGWKAWFAALRLNEAWMYRVECGVTSLA